ncbi:hypothetical protein ACHAW6_000822, partial [Cyclotella cf. meneghiniana]
HPLTELGVCGNLSDDCDVRPTECSLHETLFEEKSLDWALLIFDRKMHALRGSVQIKSWKPFPLIAFVPCMPNVDPMRGPFGSYLDR